MPVKEPGLGEQSAGAGSHLAGISPRIRVISTLAAVAVGIQLGVPSWRLAVFCSACIVCTVLLGYRVARRQLHPAGMWQMITLSFALISAAGVFSLCGQVGGLGLVLVFLAHLCAVPALLSLALFTKDTYIRMEGRWAEWLLLAASGVTSSVQIATMPVSDHGLLLTRLFSYPSSPPADMLLICLLLRLVLTRTNLPAGIRLLLWGGALLLTFDVIIGAGSDPTAAAHSRALVVGLVGVVLVIVAVLDPAGTNRPPSGEHYLARGSVRVLSTTPLVLIPAAIWLGGYLGVLPPSSAAFVAVTQIVITVCALLLAVQCLRSVEDLAELDVITGAANRRGLPRVTRALLSRRSAGSGACLAVIDLDDFKSVNDRHGHDVGDALLRAVADRLRHSVGKHGVVCRTGGDEFVVVYLDNHPDRRPQMQTRKLAERIAVALDHPCEIAGLQIKASASVGVTPLNRASDLRQVMVNSDAAMYAAKKAAKTSGGASAERTKATDGALPGRSRDQEDRVHAAHPTAS